MLTNAWYKCIVPHVCINRPLRRGSRQPCEFSSWANPTWLTDSTWLTHWLTRPVYHWSIKLDLFRLDFCPACVSHTLCTVEEHVGAWELRLECSWYRHVRIGMLYSVVYSYHMFDACKDIKMHNEPYDMRIFKYSWHFFLVFPFVFGKCECWLMCIWMSVPYFSTMDYMSSFLVLHLLQEQCYIWYKCLYFHGQWNKRQNLQGWKRI